MIFVLLFVSLNAYACVITQTLPVKLLSHNFSLVASTFFLVLTINIRRGKKSFKPVLGPTSTHKWWEKQELLGCKMSKPGTKSTGHCATHKKVMGKHPFIPLCFRLLMDKSYQPTNQMKGMSCIFLLLTVTFLMIFSFPFFSDLKVEEIN